MDTPCIEWTGHRAEFGYGRRRVSGRRWMTHRLAWVEAHGEIPAGMCVLHRCDNPPCINVAHLFLGTKGDNNRDRGAKGRGAPQQGEHNPRARLTPAQVDAIRADPRPQRTIAIEYGVRQPAVSRIKTGVRWAHSELPK